MNKIDPKIPAGPLAEKWSNYKSSQKLVNPANKRRLDIIVVGTGLAGASAAAGCPARTADGQQQRDHRRGRKHGRASAPAGADSIRHHRRLHTADHAALSVSTALLCQGRDDRRSEGLSVV